MRIPRQLPGIPGRRTSPRLSRVGNYTFRFHAPALALEGVVQGAFSLNDIILKKTLHASDAVLTTYVTGQSAALLFPALWTDLTRGRYLRSSYLWFGGTSRLALLALALVVAPAPFAAIVLGSILLAYALIPTQNMLYQSNYRAGERGHAFGAARRIYALGFLIAALGAGVLLEWNSYAYRGYYIAVALLGFASFLLLGRVRLRRGKGQQGGEAEPAPAPPRWRLGNSLRVLLADRAFLRYEAFFFCYGMAFMMLQPVLPVFLVENVKVDYAQAGMAKGLIMYGLFFVVSPFAGRLCDRWGPVRLAGWSFALLALFPLALCFVTNIAGVYIAFAIYGGALASVDIAWNLGPIHFARGRDSTTYMGAHTALVAGRALLGGPAGMIIMRAAGTPLATFLTAAGFLCIGSAGMFLLSHTRAERGGEARG